MTRNKRKHYAELWNRIMNEYPLCWNYKECKRVSNQFAHIVANTKANHKKYGWWAVNHEDNIRQSCCLCNDKAMTLARGDAGKKAHMEKIHAKLKDNGIDPWKGRI